MPLLRKQPFHKQKIPHDLHPEEEVFHCKITNEIFRDYNAFFERIILCNSLVWSCAVTGKSGLTYQESEECEAKAKKNLSTFPETLKKSLLFLATLTHRSRLNDMNDDVFLFAKDRFFIGETLDYLSKDHKRTPCKVVEVIPPLSEKKSNGDIIVIDDSDEDSNAAAAASENKSEKKKKGFGTDPMRIEYKVLLKGASAPITSTSLTLSRKKNLYTRDRSKLFLKQNSDPVNGLWKVKELVIRKYNLAACKYEDIFAGPPPPFEKSAVKRKNNAKKSLETPRPSSVIEEPPEKGPQIEYVPMPTAEDRAREKEKLKQQKLEEQKKRLEEKEVQRLEMKRQIELEKIRRKEEKDKERIKKMEEKRRDLELYREWSKPRDDLECDDLKDMPEFVPVRTRVPMELFGDAVMILEFVHIFKTIFDFKQFFPKGMTWGMVESALMDHEPDGPLCDLLQMLLCALFNLQEEEAEEYQELAKEEKKSIEDKDDDVDDEHSANEVIRAATFMAKFSQNNLGMPLRDTLLDQFTLTEILRIHLLSSGARGTARNARFRYQQRGGYTSQDDPGLELKLEDPMVVKRLVSSNVFDLNANEKAKIINVLIQQILTYAMVRDMVEESADKLRLKKYDLKQVQWAEQRREREESATRYKKMMEEKSREQARRMQQLLAEQKGGPAPEPIEEKSEAEKEAEKQKEFDMDTRKKSEFSKKEYAMLEEILSLQKTASVCPLGRDRFYRRYYFFTSLNALFVEDHELHVPADMFKPGAASAETKLKLLPELSLHEKPQQNGLAGKSNGGDCIEISDDEEEGKKKKTSEDDSGEPKTGKSESEETKSEVHMVNGDSEECNKDNDDSEEMKKNNNDTGEVKKDSGHFDDVKEENGDLEQVKEEVGNSEQVKEENGHSELVKEVNGNSDQIKEENDNSEKVKEENVPTNDVTEQVTKDNISGRDTPPTLKSIDSIVKQERGESQNPTWAFIDTPEHLDALISSLNQRGFRESALKTSLMELKPLLKHSLRDCPTEVLSLPEDGGVEKARIQALALTRGISSKKAAEDALMTENAETTMEINLRDAILDMEDRIHVGALGVLKLNDRKKWRTALLKKTYDSQSDDPIFNTKPLMNGTDKKSQKKTEPVARDLAKALVQIARGVEQRFLREPLKEDESKKKKSSKKKKDDDDSFEEPEDKKIPTLYERWEESLLGASSLSQVYLHLASLDKSIMWAKSTLETRCKLCRRKVDPEKMLLCDGCDRGHHMYCLKPPVKNVPKGDWFCPECLKKKAPRSPRKGKRKAFVEEEEEVAVEIEEQEDEEEQMEEEEEADEEEEAEEEDETLEETLEEEDGEEEDEEEEEEEEEDDDDVDVDSDDDDDDDDDMDLDTNQEEELCAGCKTAGTLIMCDGCPRAYHLECAKPVLKKVPKGKWLCQVCLGNEGKIKMGGLKFGKASSKGKSTEKSTKVKDKSGSSNKSTPNNSQPGSRRESPRDSPVLGARPRKNPLSSLAYELDDDDCKPKKKRSRLSYEPSSERSPVINPSSKRANSQQQQLKVAEELVNELIKHEDAWPFLKPVDKKLVPDYYQVIKRPMDFGTIRNKIHAFTYSKPSEMLSDVRLIFTNCIEYNASNSPEYKAYKKLSKMFDKRVKELSLVADVPTPVKNSKGRVSV